MLERNYVITESGVVIAVEPDFEYFMGALYTGYCGACGRMMFTGGATAAKLRENLKVCKWCGTPVKIPEDLKDRKC